MIVKYIKDEKSVTVDANSFPPVGTSVSFDLFGISGKVKLVVLNYRTIDKLNHVEVLLE